jgi:hypothetical protein
MKVGGKLVHDDDVFTVARCDHPGDPAGALCRFLDATDTRVLDTTIQQAMRDYLRKRPVIRPAVEGRISAEDSSGHVWSQYELARSSGE